MKWLIDWTVTMHCGTRLSATGGLPSLEPDPMVLAAYAEISAERGGERAGRKLAGPQDPARLDELLAARACARRGHDPARPPRPTIRAAQALLPGVRYRAGSCCCHGRPHGAASRPVSWSPACSATRPAWRRPAAIPADRRLERPRTSSASSPRPRAFSGTVMGLRRCWRRALALPALRAPIGSGSRSLCRWRSISPSPIGYYARSTLADAAGAEPAGARAVPFSSSSSSAPTSNASSASFPAPGQSRRRATCARTTKTLRQPKLWTELSSDKAGHRRADRVPATRSTAIARRSSASCSSSRCPSSISSTARNVANSCGMIRAAAKSSHSRHPGEQQRQGGTRD